MAIKKKKEKRRTQTNPRKKETIHVRLKANRTSRTERDGRKRYERINQSSASMSFGFEFESVYNFFLASSHFASRIFTENKIKRNSHSQLLFFSYLIWLRRQTNTQLNIFGWRFFFWLVFGDIPFNVLSNYKMFCSNSIVFFCCFKDVFRNSVKFK